MTLTLLALLPKLIGQLLFRKLTLRDDFFELAEALELSFGIAFIELGGADLRRFVEADASGRHGW